MTDVPKKCGSTPQIILYLPYYAKTTVVYININGTVGALCKDGAFAEKSFIYLL